MGTEIPAPEDCREAICRVLAKYLSPIVARATVARAAEAAGVSRHQPDARELTKLFTAVEASAAPLLTLRERSLLRGELEFELTQRISRPARERGTEELHEIRSPWDVSLARTRARELIATLGAASTDVVKCMTIVSELARNIVLYAGGGHLVFVAEPGRFVIRAVDGGPGIPHLEAVLMGRHRSAAGLGRGLRGVKLAADRFEVLTGPTGTRIEVELRL